MMKKAISVFVALACIFFAVCQANQQEYIAIEKALQSLSKVVVKYKSEFDTKVKFRELQEAIDAIDESMLDYQGIAKNKLDQLRTLNSDARRIYQDCVGPVFEWCVSINSTLDIFIPYISDPELTDHDRNIIWNITVDALSSGQKKTYNSLQLIKVVQEKTSALKNLFDAILHDVHYDFSPTGFYGKQKQELMNAIEETKKAHEAIVAAELVNLIFASIAAVVTGPIGAALQFLPKFIELGLEDALLEKKQATYEEQLEAIQTFFNLLDEKINHASEIAAQVSADLEEEKTNLYALAGHIAAADRNKQMLLMNSPTLRAKLVPSFRNLGNKCYEYTMWHGYGSEGYKHERPRTRRHVTESCNAQRLKAMTTIITSFPSNTTFETMVAKAHAILNEIDCESLPTPPGNDELALQLSEEYAEPTTIDEDTNESLSSSLLEKRSSRTLSILLSKKKI